MSTIRLILFFLISSTLFSNSIEYTLNNNSIRIIDKHFIIKPVKINSMQKSIDGTVKYSFKLHDNLIVEGVLIPSKNRITACISSQVGCSLTCAFCATGKLKMKRNLDYPEIYDQVYILNQEAKSKFGTSARCNDLKSFSFLFILWCLHHSSIPWIHLYIHL